MSMRPYEVKVENFFYSPPNSSKGVLHDISFNVAPGEMAALIGRNGQGKTSIIQGIAGELKRQYTGGKISVGTALITKPISKVITGVSIVHQFVQDDLLPDLSVGNNIKLRQLFGNNGRYRHQGGNEQWTSGTNQWLTQWVGDKDFKVELTTLVKTLSGGQRQLLNVLIALWFEYSVNGCQLLLLDEPLTGLDFVIQKQVTQLIDELTIDKRTNRRDTTIIMVTHDLQIALNYCDKIILIKEGRVLKIFAKGDLDWTEDEVKKYFEDYV